MSPRATPTDSLSSAETLRRKADDIRATALSMPHPSASYLRESKRLYVKADVLEHGRCTGRWKGCTLHKGHTGDCLDREGWSSPMECPDVPRGWAVGRMNDRTRATLPEWEPDIGEVVAVRSAGNLWLRKVVVGLGGHDFPCWNVTWEGADLEVWTPWPIEDVYPLSEYPEAMSRTAYFDSIGAL